MTVSEHYKNILIDYGATFDVSRKGSTYKKIFDLAGSGNRILDVGYSTGYFGAELKKNGNTVCGVEISDKAAQEAQKRLDGVVNGNVETIELPYKEGEFDVIVCADVLEHLFDPSLVLAKLKKYLKANGKVIVVVPNIAFLMIRIRLLFGIFDYDEKGIMDKGHVRFFTRKTAREMIKRAGFHIEKEDSTIGFNRAIDLLPSFLKGPFLFISKLLLLTFPRLFACNFIYAIKKVQ